MPLLAFLFDVRQYERYFQTTGELALRERLIREWFVMSDEDCTFLILLK